MKLRVASFDIGSRNFAFYVEEFETELLEDLKGLVPSHKLNKGLPCKEYADLLQKVYSNGKRIALGVFDLTENPEGERLDLFEPRVLLNMTELLRKYEKIFIKCDLIIIEEQMSWKIKNLNAIKVGQHCFSHFVTEFCGHIPVVEWPARYKTQAMGAPLHLTPYKRKRWSRDLAIKILEERHDNEAYNLMTIDRKSKADDLGDTINQLQSFKILAYVEELWGRSDGVVIPYRSVKTKIKRKRETTTVKTLKALCEKKGLKNYSSLKKKELLQLLNPVEFTL